MSLEALPPALVARLEQHADRLAREEFLDRFRIDTDIGSLVRELNDVCLDMGVIGYHHTRAIEADLRRDGLIAIAGAERRARFRAEYGHRFSAQQLRWIDSQWAAYFDRQQNRARDRRVWFTLTIDIADRGVDPLLRHFGGEAVYMPLIDDEGIASVLRTIGEPLIVACALDGKMARTFMENPWGWVWLSTYHQIINPKAHRLDLDVYVDAPIPPGRIVHIHSASALGWS